MPNRTAINKYELFLTEVRKIAKKKDLQEREREIKEKAMIIAALSSRSWKTYRYMYEGAEFDKIAIVNEARSAFTEGWKDISEREIEEVVNSNVREDRLSMWSFYVFDKGERQRFIELLYDIKKELVNGIEPLEISSSE